MQFILEKKQKRNTDFVLRAGENKTEAHYKSDLGKNADFSRHTL